MLGDGGAEDHPGCARLLAKEGWQGGRGARPSVQLEVERVFRGGRVPRVGAFKGEVDVESAS